MTARTSLSSFSYNWFETRKQREERARKLAESDLKVIQTSIVVVGVAAAVTAAAPVTAAVATGCKIVAVVCGGATKIISIWKECITDELAQVHMKPT